MEHDATILSYLSLPERRLLRRRMRSLAASAETLGPEEYPRYRDAWLQHLSAALGLTQAPAGALPAADAELVAQLAAEMGGGLDLLSWSFQNWQGALKRKHHGSGSKAGEDDLPCLTQIFTERYMVRFLLENTLGSWWLARHGGPLPCPMPYLSAPLDAASLSGWPGKAEALRVLDPCCGTGLFLAEAMRILAAFRRAEEGRDAASACMAVLRDNIAGVELDASCALLGRHTLALACRQLCGEWPEHRIPIEAAAPLDGASGWADAAMLLGSLLDPGTDAPGIQAPFLDQLARPAHLVATNVPYLARARQAPIMRDLCAERYPAAKRDLATVFLLRCLELAKPGGIAALVTPHNWLYLKSYTALREALLRHCRWHAAARLGEGAFESPDAAGAFVALVLLQRAAPPAGSSFRFADGGHAKGPEAKAAWLRQGAWTRLRQDLMAGAAPHRIAATAGGNLPKLADVAEIHTGLQTGDNPRYVRYFWELPRLEPPWVLQQSTPDVTAPFRGREQVLLWEDGQGALASSPGARIQGLAAMGCQGVAVRLMRRLAATRYTGEIGDQTAAIIIPRDPDLLPALWAYVSAPEFSEAVRALDGKINLAPATLGQVPFDAARWRRAAVPLSPPRSDDPDQWLFHGSESRSTRPLQVAAAHALGYRWPAEKNSGNVPAPYMLLDPEAPARLQAECRLREQLHMAFGEPLGPQAWQRLLQTEGAPSGWSMLEWLKRGFFRAHCTYFRHRPFIWHLWDGHPRGFQVLVHCHRLDVHVLEEIAYGAAARWEHRQAANTPALEAVRRFRNKMQSIIEGEAPHDIFVRWKDLAEQPVGWRPDWNDGVRVNIRPFMEAGLLRYPPRIRWTRDRGADTPGAPWHGLFQGARVNSHHLSLAEKQAVRRCGSKPRPRGG